MFFLREWEVIWKNSRRDWNEQIEDLQFIQNWIQHTKVLTGTPHSWCKRVAPELSREQWQKIGQSQPVMETDPGIQRTCPCRIRSEKSTPVSRVSGSFPWMSLDWKCQSNPRLSIVCGFNMFQPPENHYIFIQIHILNRDGNPWKSKFQRQSQKIYHLQQPIFPPNR